MKDSEKMKIAIVGQGNVGSHLANAFEGNAVVSLINSRTLENFPENADIILLCVKDDAIVELAQKIPETCVIIAHTSGSVPLSALDTVKSKTGVFYPLQTFTKNIPIHYSEIPFFIEGSDKETEEKLAGLAKLISNNVTIADSEQRKQLHLASVFACNFTNALMGISEELLEEKGIDKSTLLPLLKQTLAKLESIPAKKAQTGPAVRRDMKIIESHLELLKDKPIFREVYEVMTKVIMNQD